MPHSPTDIDTTTLASLTRLAGLSLTPERLSQLLPSFQALRRDMARLQEVELGETEPAGTFNPGQED